MDQNREHENLRENLRGGDEQPKEQLKIRCPDCLKLYTVKSAEIHEARPRFQCVDCQTQFWISFSEAIASGEEIMGFPLDWLGESSARDKKIHSEISAKAFSCPKCGQAYASGDTECVKCGVVFLRFKDTARPSQDDVRASVEVRELWEAVLADYDNFEKHQIFINAAIADRSLPYAAGQYARILEVCPQDVSAQKAQKEITSMAFAGFESNVVRSEPAVSGLFSGLDFSFRKIRLTTYIMFMCGVVIAMGILLPHQRNLVGVGTAVMFFILALRYYFRVI
jgi:predicted  nucleic acid-binding Zn-ribbon protein